MQKTRVQSLIQEDPTCRGAAKPEHLVMGGFSVTLSNVLNKNNADKLDVEENERIKIVQMSSISKAPTVQV